MRCTLIKRLEFPEFHATLLGIDDQPVSLLADAALAANIAVGLQAVLPGSAIGEGMIERGDFIDLVGYSPEAEARSGITCYPNETEIDQAIRAPIAFWAS